MDAGTPYKAASSMITVILTIHTLIVLALIGVVLLQRSEGGALGMGGGGGGFMTGRGAANVLTRTTSILAALFFATSMALAIFAGSGETDQSVLDQLTGSQNRPATTEDGLPAPATTDDLLRTLGAEPDTANPAPDAAAGTQAPPADAATESPADTAPASETGEPAEETTPPSDENGE